MGQQNRLRMPLDRYIILTSTRGHLGSTKQAIYKITSKSIYIDNVLIQLFKKQGYAPK
jgi:hypothetical protein